MNVLVISDSHGNINAIRHVLGFAKSQNMQAIFHCGDFSTAQDVVEILRTKLPFYAVTGNADEARYDEIWNALSGSSAIYCAPDVWEGELGGRKIAMAHQPEKVREQIRSREYDAVFHGHLHMMAKAEFVGNTLVVNPGALSNTTKPSFAVYDTELNEAEIVPVVI